MPPPEEDPTHTTDTPAPEPAARRAAGGVPDDTCFAPGVVLAGRYRIVSLLGRGGMGEVYRADDLTLDQPVALKLLPARLAQDPARLARFLNEVRVARQVTHRHVCRVHDVGEADGRRFLTMEYVDGEDLASLLRRAGRLTVEKGIELARQICLGLAAAHERGVLHRDLKPANVMVDGRGRARITDFGLAMAADEAARSAEIAGTPAYMAPEQLEGRGVSERSDVYALGLVLYEIFTGRPAFRAPSLEELVRLQRGSAPAAPSSHVDGLDPGLERLILSCLEKDPSRRPPGAIAVAAALPGGDPLQALVAAGETPPPELVAAGGGERVALAPAWAGAALVLLGLPVALGLMESLTFLHGVTLDRPPAVLLEDAREVARLASGRAGAGTACGFEHAPAAPREARIRFWYREAPRRLDALQHGGQVTPDDPPLGPGMLRVRVDTEGRLLELLAIPGEVGSAVEAKLDWNPLLERTGVDPDELKPAVPSRVPPTYADQRTAWEASDGRRLEAAALGGRPVFLTSLPTPAPSPRPRDAAGAVVWFAVIGFGAVLAARNLSSGRGDRRGALHIGVWIGVSRLLAWALIAPHTADLRREQSLFIDGLGRSLFSGAQVWLLYLAIEPAIRRRWPTCLITWTRLVQGRWRDPLVGRDLLAGIAGATAMGLLWAGARAASDPATPLPVDLDFLLGLRPFAAWLLTNQITAVAGCLWLLVLALVSRVVFRDLRLAALATALLFTGLISAGLGGTSPLELLAGAVVAVLLVALLLHFGMLAVVTASFFLGSGSSTVPATLDFSAWHGQVALAWMLTGYAIALLGLFVASGGRPLPASMLED